jgi:hypothetical protein
MWYSGARGTLIYEKNLKVKISLQTPFKSSTQMVLLIVINSVTNVSCLGTYNPLPHRVMATFSLTAGGLIRPPEEGDISTVLPGQGKKRK